MFRISDRVCERVRSFFWHPLLLSSCFTVFKKPLRCRAGSSGANFLQDFPKGFGSLGPTSCRAVRRTLRCCVISSEF